MRQQGLRALMLGVATVTLVGGLPAAAGQAATGQATVPAAFSNAATAKASTAAPVTITLITGDRVTVRAGGVLSVEPAADRAGVRFLSRLDNGHRYVIPSDALPLIHAGRLDDRLFDITTLTEFGYTDATGELPLLVSYPVAGGARAKATAGAAATVAGSRVVRELPVLGALAVQTPAAGRSALWNSLTVDSAQRRALRAGVDKIWLDGKRKVNLDKSVPQIGAPTAWKAGLDGKGVTVAVLDTGIDATHADLAGQILGAKNFTTEADADDKVGHGTHVASTIAGTGVASKGKFKGVAPGAKLLNGKVCGLEDCSESSILAGMEWAAQQGAQVANMSLGGGDRPSIDPLEKAVNDLTAQFGTLFVVAAGNSGWGGAYTVGSPASADAALAVAAVDRKDKIAGFSSQGPRVGDDAVKPEISAPGVDIVAAKAKNDVIGTDGPVKGYTALSGTSMATPHVAGAAALLVQQHPNWSAAQRKTVLIGSAKKSAGYGAFVQGAGRVDVTRMIKQSVFAEPGTLSFGKALWPHNDDPLNVRPLTYRNIGTAPVTLTFSATIADPKGKEVPKGFFTLSPKTLVVPAGGTASTTVTLNTSIPTRDGLYNGFITASAAGGVQVTTPYGINRERQSYDVALKHTHRDGTAANEYLTVFSNLATGETFDFYKDGAATTARLPKGTYGVFSWIYTGIETPKDFSDDSTTMLVQPKLVVDKASALGLDARLAGAVAVTVPDADASSTLVAVGADWTTSEGGFGATALSDRQDQVFTGQIGPKAATKGFTASANLGFAKLDDKGSAKASPYTYDLAWAQRGTFYQGLKRTVAAKDLATVTATYAQQAIGVEGVKVNFASLPDVYGGWAVGNPFSLPARRTEHLSTQKGTVWRSYFDEEIPAVSETEWPVGVAGQFGEDFVVVAGKAYRQNWNRAVFGPTVKGDYPSILREKNTIYGWVALAGDGNGNPGWSRWDKSASALYRNGKKVKPADEYGDAFVVPPGLATYRFTTSAVRRGPHVLSSQIDVAWTFKSKTVAGKKWLALPVSSVRIAPPVDATNTVPAGKAATLGLAVTRQKNSSAKAVKTLTVDVSYDDGKTWKKAVVKGSGASWTIGVTHPKAAGFASLRVLLTDKDGNTLKQTIKRAYRIA
jgi:subtilisin family serine protease